MTKASVPNVPGQHGSGYGRLPSHNRIHGPNGLCPMLVEVIEKGFTDGDPPLSSLFASAT